MAENKILASKKNFVRNISKITFKETSTYFIYCNMCNFFFEKCNCNENEINEEFQMIIEIEGF